MKEDFLHFVWRFSYYITPELRTIENEKVTILNNGYWNHDSGPDFKEALIEIDGVKLAGSVEIHLTTKDWLRHGHHLDRAYDNVVLHVVWEHDYEGLAIPTLELKDVVDSLVFKAYEQFLTTNHQLKCESKLSNLPSVVKNSMLDLALFERFERKEKEVLAIYRSKKDWTEVVYTFLLKYMGFKVNNDAFLELSDRLPLKALLKHRDHLIQIEALLFGHAGFLDGNDEYSARLLKEYEFLAHKYEIKGLELSKSVWKYLRLRPMNFPTIRLAQVAMIITTNGDFTKDLLKASTVKEIRKIFKGGVGEYWKTHYRFGDKWKKPILGDLSAQSAIKILVNVVVPVRMAMAKIQGHEEIRMNLLGLLDDLKPEMNKKIDQLGKSGFEITKESDAQAGIELFDEYCMKKRCLECKIGVSILKQ